MATHSSVLAWRIPGTEEPGGLPIVSFLGKAQGRKKTHFHLKTSTICFLKESESSFIDKSE